MFLYTSSSLKVASFLGLQRCDATYRVIDIRPMEFATSTIGFLYTLDISGPRRSLASRVLAAAQAGRSRLQA